MIFLNNIMLIYLLISNRCIDKRLDLNNASMVTSSIDTFVTSLDSFSGKSRTNYDAIDIDKVLN